LVIVLLLALAVGAFELGGFGLPGDPNAGGVAAQQQDSLRRSFVASRGAHQPSERPGSLGRQRAEMATDAQSNSGTGVWHASEPSATRTPAWRRKFGGLVYETLPQILWNILQALGEGVRQVLG
jgi:hypothetical protein